MISPKQPRAQSSFLPSLKISSSNSPAVAKKVPDIDTVCENLLNDSDYQFDLYYTAKEVIAHLHEMCDFIMCQEEDFDYDLLQRIDEVIEEVTSKDQELCATLTQQDSINQLNVKLEKTKDEISKIENRFSNVKQNFEEKKKEDIIRLKNCQKKEIEEFKFKYSMNNMPPRYTKLSANIINMRTLERKLRIMHKFPEAKQIRDEADQKEKEEMEINCQKWLNEREIAKSALIKKHQQQMKCLLEKWDRHYQVLQQSLTSETDNQQLIIKKTQRKVSEAQTKKDLLSRSPSSSVSRISTSRSRSVKSDRL